MRKLMIGTDWWTDCDDAVAMRLLCRAHIRGEIELLGIAINACMEHSVASLKAFLTAEGMGNVELGIDHTAVDFGGAPPYQARLAKRMPCMSNTDVGDAVRLYRSILVSTAGKLEIVEIGYLQVISALLQSRPDDISDKSGMELFSEKVSKCWVMAGKWDADGEKENNFCRNARSRIAGRDFCELCPVPVTFLGWEVGFGVLSGGALTPGDHLYDVLADHGSLGGRHSWDPMLVQMALIGDETQAGYETVSGRASVDAQTGANYFTKVPDGPHKYVVKKFGNDYYQKQIDDCL